MDLKKAVKPVVVGYLTELGYTAPQIANILSISVSQTNHCRRIARAEVPLRTTWRHELASLSLDEQLTAMADIIDKHLWYANEHDPHITDSWCYLTQYERRLARTLVECAPSMVSYEMIIQAVYFDKPPDVDPNPKSIDVLCHRLNTKNGFRKHGVVKCLPKEGRYFLPVDEIDPYHGEDKGVR